MNSYQKLCSIEQLIHELDIQDTSAPLSQADTQGCSESESNRSMHFSELVMTVPPETNAFCSTLLWTLKNKGVVQNWRWEDGVLRVWADTDALSYQTSNTECCGGSWLLRLIQATQHFDDQQMNLSARPDFFAFGEEAATDFSYLGCDYGLSMMQAA
jgi:hypothetical protein